MILNKLAVENFGLFSGKHSFDLHTHINSDDFKPIVLFGGLNGAGKTTLFDAIKLCLYGKALFPRISDNDYKQYLIDKIHYFKVTGKVASKTSISIQFRYSHFGNINTYDVIRSWQKSKEDVKEEVLVFKDGNPLDFVEEAYWSDFIKELIPIGLSELFFFDGEKIQRIISGENDNEFRESIKSLLGIDLLDRLKTDIKIYQTRKLKKKASAKIQSELDKYLKEKKQLESELKTIYTDLSSLENDVQSVADDVSRYKEKIVQQGGNFLEAKDDLKSVSIKLEKDIDDLEEQMRSIASDGLPIAICSQLADRLKEQLRSELKLQEDKISNKILQQKKDELINKLTKNINKLNIGNKFIRDLNHLILNEIDLTFTPTDTKSIKELFQYSEKTTNDLVSLINFSSSIPAKLDKIGKKYEDSVRMLQQNRKTINQAPAEELIKPMFDKLNELLSSKAALDAKKSNLTEQKNKLLYHLAEVERNLDRINEKKTQNKKIDTVLSLSHKVLSVIDIYKEQLAHKKVNELERMFKLSFNKLHRKKMLINKIEIDPITFNISLYDVGNNKIVKENLSSGEKEIYAISLISALAKVSGHNLPFIIDTPLGRLDSNHRLNLINNFFPHASHQMIIFSTNTEVDKPSFEALQPFLARSYNIEYDQKSGTSAAIGGYFWK